MGTYYIPRNVKGEGRILFIFSKKALIYTVLGVVVSLPFYFILNAFGATIVGIVIAAIFGGIGFFIGTFKMPEINGLDITKRTGGENIDDVIRRAIKFKMKKNKIYIYGKEETKDE